MLNNMIIKAQIGLAKKAQEKMLAKKAGDETLIVKIILMVVAVVLCILFRDTLKDIITTLLTNVETNISNIYN